MKEIGSEIFINSQGEWLYEGNKIVHPEVLSLFKNSLTVDEKSGEFYIDYKGKRAPVKVAETPYFVRDAVAKKDPAGNLLEVILEIDDGSREILDPKSLTLDASGVLQVKVKSGKFAARCLAAAHFRIAELLDSDDEGGFFIVINQNRFNLKEKGED
ncbi:MAG: hypothetical protein DRH03_01630 [Deltaproteobacteria bacterium]|nr:MAG: hypothetical protein DRH03_01630 [Deltaproteobacteria bacterium]